MDCGRCFIEAIIVYYIKTDMQSDLEIKKLNDYSTGVKIRFYDVAVQSFMPISCYVKIITPLFSVFIGFTLYFVFVCFNTIGMPFATQQIIDIMELNS